MAVQQRIQALVWMLLTSITCFAQQNTFHLEDLNKLTSISSLSISPDGKSAIFMTANRNMETNRFDRALMLLTIRNKEAKQIAKEFAGISSPSWTKDGKSISFFASREAGRQLFVWNVKSGSSSVVLNAEAKASRYYWSPNGKHISYSVREPAEPENENSFNDAFKVGSNDYFVQGPSGSTSVWIADADGRNAMKITPEGFTVATGLTTSSISWSPDSKMIAFTKYPSPNSGDSDLGRNFIYDLDSKEMKAVTSNTQRESSPVFHPDGKSLIYRYPRDGFPSNMVDLHQVDLATGQISNISQSFDKATSGTSWTGSGAMVVRAIDQWGNGLFQFDGAKAMKLNIGELASVASFSMAKDGSMVLTAAKKDLPAEIYYKKNLNADPVQLTDFHSFIKDINLGMQEGIEWSSSDGLLPTGIITYPPNFDPNKTYPLVLQIHGGPSASSLLGFSPVTQAMAAKGWIVFQPNYRGSTNGGNKFQSAISKDPSEGPGHDVITGVNVLKEKSYVDADRIGVSGWSYGGWMTSWLIGRYPEVWTAAVAGAAPVDWTDMYSLNDLNRMRRHSIVESPYVGDNLTWAYENSPISNFSKLKTPTLIMSKTGDARVTITGSYKLYGALRDNNVPVEFIAYPGPGHFPSDPVRSLDVYTRWIGWLEKYLGDEESMEATIENK
ncbi:MAG: S9 family peptidase [Cytophagales bacterium]|nr:S9 family peptidase [Cytophagales bacterium]